MLNKIILADKFSKLIVGPKDKFVEKVGQIRDVICRNKIDDTRSVLLFGTDNRESIYYTFGVYYSLLAQRVLDYAVTTGQHFINQHFLSEENKDLELYRKIYSSDILFISLSQYDYTSDYLESLLIDLVDTRSINKKPTIIYYDTLSNKNYITTTKKLSDYFIANHLVIDLTKQPTTPSTTTSGQPTTKTNKTTKAGKRFI